MNKKVVTSTALEGRPLAAASEVHYCSAKEISETEEVISEEDEAVLKLVEELAVAKNLRLHVIDVARLSGKLRAKLRGVKATPTIIVGNGRLTGVLQKKEVEAPLRGN
jgi:hypothetical protein